MRRQLTEIFADPVLRIYGVVLGLLELVCVLWLCSVRADRMLSVGNEALCWPMLPNCGAWRAFSMGALQMILVVCAILSVATALAFYYRSSSAWLLLLTTEVLKLAVIAQDFRLRLNQNYMFGFVWLAFLFIPNKRRNIRYLLVLFYFWAGILKVNREWLTGAALYRPEWLLHSPLLRLACGYVVLLELVVVWGLLAERAWIFWLAFMQVVLFEAFSFFTVGFFYPTLMLGLSSLFPLGRSERESLFRLRFEPASTLIFLSVFCGLQLVPRMFPGDTAITGEGRLVALHMFDAKVECESKATLFNAGRAMEVFDMRPDGPVRTKCDPAMLLSRGQTLCAGHSNGAWRVDVHLASRRSSEPALRPVVDIQDFCRNIPAYRWWRHNDWIRVD